MKWVGRGIQSQDKDNPCKNWMVIEHTGLKTWMKFNKRIRLPSRPCRYVSISVCAQESMSLTDLTWVQSLVGAQEAEFELKRCL